MKLIITDEEIDLKPIIVESDDRGKVITPSVGIRDTPNRDELTKEIIAIDAIELGVNAAAKLHGIDHASTSRYKDGIHIQDEDAKTRILSRKHGIADTAVAKLMETLNMFDPSDLEKPMDKIRAAKDLASIVDHMSPQNKNEGNGEIHLHMYSPKQRPMKEFEVIDV